MDLHLTSKFHDLIATLAGGGVIAITLSDVETWIRILTGIVGLAFLLLGFILRAMDIRDRHRKAKESPSPTIEE